jgi:hypothetical protein
MPDRAQVDPLTIINALRESDKYIETIYMNGGCYQFHLMLKKIYPDAIAVINEDKNHVGTLVNGDIYDINGVIDWSFRAMDDDDIAIAETWSFHENQLISLGECGICEEPIVV